MNNKVYIELVRATGEAILALVAASEDDDEFFASRNTLAAVERLLLDMTSALSRLPPGLHRRLRELDWHGWEALHRCVHENRQPRREQVWYAVNALVPATLTLLTNKRVLRTME